MERIPKPLRIGRQRFALCLAFILVAGVSLRLRGQDLPQAPQAQVFTLTPAPGYFTEPAIAVNPSNPQQVVGVFQDNAHAAYSQDAGRTWQLAEGVARRTSKSPATCRSLSTIRAMLLSATSPSTSSGHSTTGPTARRETEYS